MAASTILELNVVSEEETEIVVPNTGMFTGATESQSGINGGIIIVGIVAILAIVASIVFYRLSKKVKGFQLSNKKFSVASLFSMIVFLFSAGLTMKMIIAEPYSTNAVNDNVDVALTSDERIIINKNKSDESLSQAKVTVKLTKPEQSGYIFNDYILYMEATELKNENGDIIDTVVADELPNNTWGYKLSEGEATYHKIPYVESVISSADWHNNIEEVEVSFYIKISPEVEDGKYTSVINFRAVSDREELSACGSVPTMQNISTIKSSLALGAQTQLCDNRDGKLYWVVKLQDGKIWMTQNLDYELSTEVTLTPNDSDVLANWTPKQNTQNYQYKAQNGTIKEDAVWEGDYNIMEHSYRPALDVAAGSSGDYGNDGDTYFAPVFMKNGTTMQAWKNMSDCIVAGNLKEQCEHWNVGTFYSWYAATAGTGDESIIDDNVNAAGSICPKGWKLPSSTESGDFQNLFGDTEEVEIDAINSPFYLIHSGRYLGYYGAVYNTDNDGYYWSSTSDGDTNARDLYVGTNGVLPSDSSPRYNGMNVRCVAR